MNNNNLTKTELIMRKFIRFSITPIMLFLNLVVLFSAPFTDGNIVVTRVGDGVAPINYVGSGTNPPQTHYSLAVYIDEYTPEGVLVQSIPMPTTTVGDNRRFVYSSLSQSAEGLINLSVDGKYLTLLGYDAAPGITGVLNSTSTNVNRVIARIDNMGNINTETALNDAFSGVAAHSVISTDGTDFWITGGEKVLDTLHWDQQARSR